jgi:hypothetical protein
MTFLIACFHNVLQLGENIKLVLSRVVANNGSVFLSGSDSVLDAAITHMFWENVRLGERSEIKVEWRDMGRGFYGYSFAVILTGEGDARGQAAARKAIAGRNCKAVILGNVELDSHITAKTPDEVEGGVRKLNQFKTGGGWPEIQLLGCGIERGTLFIPSGSDPCTANVAVIHSVEHLSIKWGYLAATYYKPHVRQNNALWIDTAETFRPERYSIQKTGTVICTDGITAWAKRIKGSTARNLSKQIVNWKRDDYMKPVKIDAAAMETIKQYRRNV